MGVQIHTPVQRQVAPSGALLGAGSSGGLPLAIDVSAAPSAKPSVVEFGAAPSAITAASQNTTALQYAQYLAGVGPTNCTVNGGGCTLFQDTLASCVADDCACQDELTLAAMVCAQCTATQEAVMVYNTYLTYCSNEGMTDPTDTFLVSIGGSTTGQQTITSTVGATVFVSASQAGGLPSVQTPSGAGEALVQTSANQAVVSPSGRPGVAAVGLIQTSASTAASAASPTGLAGALDGSNALLSGAPSTSVLSAVGLGGISPSSNGAISGGLASMAGPSSGAAVAISASAPAASGSGAGAALIGGVPTTVIPLKGQGAQSTSGLAATGSVSGVLAPSASVSGSGVVPSSALNATMLNGTSLTETGDGGLDGKQALNAAIAFFSNATVSACDDNCTVWKGLSNVSLPWPSFRFPKGSRELTDWMNVDLYPGSVYLYGCWSIFGCIMFSLHRLGIIWSSVSWS